MIDSTAFVYGKHAVREALHARPDIVRVVYLGENVSDPELSKLLTRTKIVSKPLNLKKLSGVDEGAVHQGVVAEIDAARLVVDYEDFMRAHEITRDSALVVLGEVQDPQNVGSVIRSAAAFGISAVLIPQHRQAQVNGTVIKVSAGMAFRIPLVQITNVNHTLQDLKDRGFWIYGLEGDAKQKLDAEEFEKASVFVLGNEGEGIRQKTLEHCDIPLRIPMHTRTESLNAATSAAVVFYAWSSKHPHALRLV